MKKTMCLYTISKSPYLAVSEVEKEDQYSCLVEDTEGNLKRVFPIYKGPFDSTKLFMFGALISRYCQKDTNFKDSLIDKSLELFGVRAAPVI